MRYSSLGLHQRKRTHCSVRTNGTDKHLPIFPFFCYVTFLRYGNIWRKRVAAGELTSFPRLLHAHRYQHNESLILMFCFVWFECWILVTSCIFNAGPEMMSLHLWKHANGTNYPHTIRTLRSITVLFAGYVRLLCCSTTAFIELLSNKSTHCLSSCQ